MVREIQPEYEPARRELEYGSPEFGALIVRLAARVVPELPGLNWESQAIVNDSYRDALEDELTKWVNGR